MILFALFGGALIGAFFVLLVQLFEQPKPPARRQSYELQGRDMVERFRRTQQ